MTRTWTCNCCGANERLNMIPDCCSYCSGSMSTEDWPSTDDDDGYDEWCFEPHEDQTDPATLIRLWHNGYVLSAIEQGILDGLMLQNRVDVLTKPCAYQEAA